MVSHPLVNDRSYPPAARFVYAVNPYLIEHVPIDTVLCFWSPIVRPKQLQHPCGYRDDFGISIKTFIIYDKPHIGRVHHAKVELIWNLETGTTNDGLLVDGGGVRRSKWVECKPLLLLVESGGGVCHSKSVELLLLEVCCRVRNSQLVEWK